jgi:hypothetical protein
MEKELGLNALCCNRTKYLQKFCRVPLLKAIRTFKVFLLFVLLNIKITTCVHKVPRLFNIST